jgi:hypothetical protein
MLLGSPSLPESMVPSANHPWQPQPPVQLLEDLSEAHAKPSVVPQSTTQGFGCNTNNPFWLRSAGPQPPVFSFSPSSSAPAGPPLFSVPLSNHPWQPQPPVQPLKYPSESHVKPSVGPQSTTQGFGCNTNNPFWLRSAGPQPPVFSFPPSSSAPATSRENIFSNTASYRAPDTSFTVSIPQRSFVREALHRSVTYMWFLLVVFVGSSKEEVYSALQSPIQHQLRHQMVNALL